MDEVSNAKDEIFVSLAAIGQALGNAHRLKILSLLSHGEKTVERLASAIDQTLATTSAHLKVLRASGLVAAEKRGRFVHYRLADEKVSTLWLSLRTLGELVRPEMREALSRLSKDTEALCLLGEAEVWKEIEEERVMLLDLRPADEFALAHLPKAHSLPFAELDSRFYALPQGKDLLVYCRGPFCLMALEGVKRLRALNYPARRLPFSVPEWRAAGLPLISS